MNTQPDFTSSALATIEQAQIDPWARCIALYLADVQERNATTYKGYVSILRAFFTMSAGRPPDYITREAVERFLHAPTRRGRGGPPTPGTPRSRGRGVSCSHNHAPTPTARGEEGKPVSVFARGPPTAGTRQVRTPRPRRVLTEDELERLFTVIPRTTKQGLRDLSLFTFFLLTGRRLNEVRGLTFGDIEWGVITESAIAFRMGWTYKWIGEKGLHGEEKVSELPVLGKVLIDEWLEASGRLPLASDDPIWIGVGAPSLQGATLGLPINPYSPLSAGTITKALKKYARAAGIDKQISVHWLRHANAKARYEKDHDIIKIMKALGHSNLASTYTYLENFLGNADAGARELAHRFGFLLK